ncbi:unnamed protein product [Clavelina lepadiformis]|uniref:Uncharacterized protein n=1 Tax=Clavelina lepadiformis TaxID=159417 RepID=A0ABP0GVZ3_CLALP
MKLLLVLLACVAAANAYSYSYWCGHQFYVYPSSYCLRYRVAFNPYWCSLSYYSKVLKTYPGEKCGEAGWTETPVATLTGQVSNALKAELTKITGDLNAARTKWYNEVTGVYNNFIAEHQKYITIYYNWLKVKFPAEAAKYNTEMQKKCAEYKKKLDDQKATADAAYRKAITDKISSVAEYHKKVVKAFSDCLTTRATKLSEYKDTSAKKIQEYVKKFVTAKFAIIEKNKENYKKALVKLFDAQPAAVDHATTYYREQMKIKVYGESRKYLDNLTKYYAALVKAYTCAYSCSVGGCLGFSKRSYYSGCTRLATFKSAIGCKYYGLGAYNYKVRCGTYKNLKTCDLAAVAKGNIDQVVADLEKKRDDTVTARTTAFNTWKSKQQGLNTQYLAAYRKIVCDRHTWYINYLTSRANCDGVITSAEQTEINQERSRLAAEKTKLYNAYKAKLDKIITDAQTSFNKRMADYKKAVNDLITKIRGYFNACTTKRTKAISDYKKKLEDKRDAYKVELNKKLVASRTAHLAHFQKMLDCYHGEGSTASAVTQLKSAYTNYIVGKTNTMVRNFCTEYQKKIDNLVKHYSCSYKCRVSACYSLPSYHCGSYYSWHFSAPKASCYTFKYSLYCNRFYC